MFSHCILFKTVLLLLVISTVIYSWDTIHLPFFCFHLLPCLRNLWAKISPAMITSPRIMNLLPGWKKRKVCFSLIFHRSLHEIYFRSLWCDGTTINWSLVTTRAFQLVLGHPINGILRSSEILRSILVFMTQLQFARIVSLHILPCNLVIVCRLLPSMYIGLLSFLLQCSEDLWRPTYIHVYICMHKDVLSTRMDKKFAGEWCYRYFQRLFLQIFFLFRRGNCWKLVPFLGITG